MKKTFAVIMACLISVLTFAVSAGAYEIVWDPEGGCIHTLTETLYEKDGSIRWTVENEYDEAGNLVKATKYRSNGGELAPESVTEYFYNEKGEYAGYKYWDLSSGKAVLKQSGEITYGENTRIVLEYEEFANDVSVPVFRDEYFDDGTKEKKSHYEYGENGEWALTEEYSHERVGNKETAVSFSYKNDAVVYGSKTECEYNADGNEVKWVHFDYDLVSGSFTASTCYEYEYNENGDVVRETVTADDGNGNVTLESVSVLEYKYDENGNAVEIYQSVFNDGSEERSIWQKRCSEYDKNGCLIMQEYYVYNNESEDWEFSGFEEYEIDAAGECLHDTEKYILDGEDFSYDKTYTYKPAHRSLKKTDRVDPTAKRDGFKAYWYCEDCGNYYADEACTVRIFDLENWKVTDGKLLVIDMIAGKNQQVDLSVSSEVKFEADADFSKLESVEFDGVAVDRDKYIVDLEKGEIGFTSDFVEEVPDGAHIVTLIFDSGVAEAGFRLTGHKDAPGTGAGTDIVSFAVLSAVIMTGAVYFAARKKK